MTRDDLITLVNDQRRDTTSSFVDNDEITRYFNQCMRLLQTEHDWDYTQASGSITYDEAGPYAVSDIGDGYFKNPINVFAGYSYQFDRVTYEEYWALSALDYNAYATRGDFLYIANGTTVSQLSVSYYTSAMAKTSGDSWMTQLVDGSDEPLMPQRFQDTLVDYALAKVYKKEGLTDDYLTSQRDYEKKVQLLKNEYISKTARPLFRWRHVSEMGAANVTYDRKEDPLGTGSR